MSRFYRILPIDGRHSRSKTTNVLDMFQLKEPQMDPPSHVVEQMDMDTSSDQRFSRACVGDRSKHSEERHMCVLAKHSEERHMCVLARQYAWLKEELTFESVLNIAEELVGAKDSVNGYMPPQLCESIRDSKRRQAVDLLLNHVLNGPLEIYLLFLTLLEANGNEYIACKLRQTKPTVAEIEEFMELQKSSVGKCLRPNAEEARFTIRDDEFEELCRLINVEAVVDSLNDFFLTKNWFSVREHTNISLCPMHQEKRLSCLLTTMKRCSYKILTDFTEALTTLGMQHVISYLNEYVLSAEGDDRTKKLQLLDREMEARIVSSVIHTPEQLRLASLQDLNFEFESMETGSIIIRLRPVSDYSWLVLKANCQSGSIKNFIAKVYKNRAIYSLLKEGRYEIDVKIYTLDIQLEASAPLRLAEMHLKDHSLPDFETDIDKQLDDGKDCTEPQSFIIQYFEVLCEEMGISNALLSYFEAIGLVDQILKETVVTKGSRAEQVRCFLTHLLNFDNTGSDCLVYFLKETTSNKALKEIIASYEVYERKLERRQCDLPEETDKDKQIQRKLFFSATAVLDARKNEITADFKDICFVNEWEIRCSEILSPRCYFGTKKEEADAALQARLKTMMNDLATDSVLSKELHSGQDRLHYGQERFFAKLRQLTQKIIDTEQARDQINTQIEQSEDATTCRMHYNNLETYDNLLIDMNHELKALIAEQRNHAELIRKYSTDGENADSFLSEAVETSVIRDKEENIIDIEVEKLFKDLESMVLHKDEDGSYERIGTSSRLSLKAKQQLRAKVYIERQYYCGCHERKLLSSPLRSAGRRSETTACGKMGVLQGVSSKLISKPDIQDRLKQHTGNK